jgi:hypothetical protein
VVDQLLEMEEIRPTHPRRPVFGLISVRFFFSFFPFFPRLPFLLLLFYFVLFFTHREMEEGDRSEIDSWSTTVLESGGSRQERSRSRSTDSQGWRRSSRLTLVGRILNLILGFSCFGLMISSEWLSGQLGLMASELVFFSGFIYGDLLLLLFWFFWFYFPFWVFVFLV